MGEMDLATTVMHDSNPERKCLPKDEVIKY